MDQPNKQEIKNWDIQFMSESIDKAFEHSEKTSIALIQKKSDLDQRSTIFKSLNMIRYLYLVIDSSSYMKALDYKPNRFLATINALKLFIPSFFDKNPLSLMALGVMYEGFSKQITEFSQNSNLHLEALKELKLHEDKEISIQNCLDQTIKLFKEAPLYANKELLLIVSATATCDPGDIFSTISDLKALKITSSVIGLSGRNHIFKILTDETEGKYEVPLDEDHYQNLIINFNNPPELKKENISLQLIKIAFPTKFFEDYKEGIATLCVCHNEIRSQYYECPICKARVCDAPSTCPICKINLISSPHLARTYRHMNRLSPFLLHHLKDEYFQAKSQQIQTQNSKCFGCDSNLFDGRKNYEEIYYSECKECHNNFCLECDIFIHDSLYNCPGCC